MKSLKLVALFSLIGIASILSSSFAQAKEVQTSTPAINGPTVLTTNLDFFPKDSESLIILPQKPMTFTIVSSGTANISLFTIKFVCENVSQTTGCTPVIVSQSDKSVKYTGTVSYNLYNVLSSKLGKTQKTLEVIVTAYDPSKKPIKIVSRKYNFGGIAK